MSKRATKLAITVIAVCVALSACAFALSACCISEHTYSESWSYDKQYHYRVADCRHKNEVTDKQEHDGDICSVCGYVDESLITKGVGIRTDGYVYADAPSWYEEYEKPESIVIPSFFGDVRVIGITEGAFDESLGNGYFSNVTRIVLPSGIERVERSGSSDDGPPFSSTAYYKDSANWENGMLYIGNCLIAVRAKELKDLHVKDGVRAISDWLWGDNAAGVEFDEITLPHSLITIGDGAFYFCKAQRVNIPENVNYIGDRAFTCTDLKEAVFENPNGWSTWAEDRSKAPTYIYDCWSYPKKIVNVSKRIMSNPEKAASRLVHSLGSWMRDYVT